MKEIEFKKDVDEMNEGELRATLRQFRSEYSEGREEYLEFEKEAAKVSEYKEQIEDLEETAEEAHDLFATLAEPITGFDKETLVEKFSTEELRDKVEETEEYTEFLSGEVVIDGKEESVEDDTSDDVEEDGQKFDNKEQKSKKTENSGKFDDRVESFFKENRMVKTY